MRIRTHCKFSCSGRSRRGRPRVVARRAVQRTTDRRDRRAARNVAIAAVRPAACTRARTPRSPRTRHRVHTRAHAAIGVIAANTPPRAHACASDEVVAVDDRRVRRHTATAAIAAIAAVPRAHTIAMYGAACDGRATTKAVLQPGAGRTRRRRARRCTRGAPRSCAFGVGMWDLAWPELDAAAPAACAALLCTLLVYLSGCRVRRPRRPRPAPPAPPATWFVHDRLCFSRALLVGGPVVCVRPLAADEAPGVAEFGNPVGVAVADPRRLCAAALRGAGGAPL